MRFAFIVVNVIHGECECEALCQFWGITDWLLARVNLANLLGRKIPAHRHLRREPYTSRINSVVATCMARRLNGQLGKRAINSNH